MTATKCSQDLLLDGIDLLLVKGALRLDLHEFADDCRQTWHRQLSGNALSSIDQRAESKGPQTRQDYLDTAYDKVNSSV